MKLHLRVTITLQFAFLITIIVFLISMVSGTTIRRRFERFVEGYQKKILSTIEESIAEAYDPQSRTWDVEYICGMGSYALREGFAVRLTGTDGEVIWDARSDGPVLGPMLPEGPGDGLPEGAGEGLPGRPARPAGETVTESMELEVGDVKAGSVEVNYYLPHYMKEGAPGFLKELNRILRLIVALLMIPSILMGILLARRITGPLLDVIRVTGKIAGGDYGARLQPARRIREMHELTVAINHMARSLEEQEKLRRRMTSDIAHELRTPVANISSYLEMMIDKVVEPTTDHLQTCYNEIKRLTGLISELERLEREETDITLNLGAVELKSLAQETLNGFETQLREKRITGTLEGEPVTVRADGGRLRQVLANLLSNAVKYTDEGGRISVRVYEKGGCGVICVEDSGIGIAPGERERIFERFYRTDKSRSRKTGGAGIGLSIVKAIVDAHRGTIVCESSVGKGSRFTVMLPKGKDVISTR